MRINLLSLVTAAYMPTHRALYWGLVTLFILGITMLLALFFWWRGWGWAWYAGVTGALYGYIVGVVVLSRVPSKVQAASFGAIAGMGLDQILSTARETDSIAAITTLAKVVSNIISSLLIAAGKTGIPAPSQFSLSVGIWVFFIFLGLMMLLGSLEPDSNDNRGKPTTGAGDS